MRIRVGHQHAPRARGPRRLHAEEADRAGAEDEDRLHRIPRREGEDVQGVCQRLRHGALEVADFGRQREEDAGRRRDALRECAGAVHAEHLP